MTAYQEVGRGNQTALNITSATLVKVGAGRIAKVSVTTAGAIGNVYDSATTAGVSAANLLAAIPATVQVFELDMPFTSGLVIAPGVAQVVTVSFS